MEIKNKAERMATMSKSQRFNINKERRYLLLNFLANGEYWTTAENVRILLGVNHLSYVRRFLDTLIAEQLLVKKSYSFGATPRNFYSITEKGLTFIDNFENRKITKHSHQTMWHNELVQRLKLIAMSVKGDGLQWLTDIQLQRGEDAYASYPDALYDNKIAIELQRNIYSFDGFVSKVAKCLKDIYSERFNKVLYVCVDNCKASQLQGLFNKIEKVKNSRNEDVFLTEEHRNKFCFIDFNQFEEYIKNE